MNALVGFGVAGVLMGLGRLALACGQPWQAYLTFGDVAPAAREGLPRDMGFVVSTKSWTPNGAAGGMFAKAQLLDAAGREIPAAVEPLYLEPDAALTVRPNEPLAPSTGYTLVAEMIDFGGTAPAPAGAEGPRTLRVSFRTGEALAPPLVLSGPLQVTLERRDVPVQTCDPGNNCGGPPSGCRQTGTRSAVFAKISLPTVDGGQGAEGYRAWLAFTADAPATFDRLGSTGTKPPASVVNLQQQLALKPGTPAHVEQEIIAGDAPYAPCFALDVWDVAGHRVAATPVCVAAKDVQAAASAPAKPPSPPSSTAALADGGGCNVASHAGASGTLSWLLVLGALVRRRRTRV